MASLGAIAVGTLTNSQGDSTLWAKEFVSSDGIGLTILTADASAIGINWSVVSEWVREPALRHDSEACVAEESWVYCDLVAPVSNLEVRRFDPYEGAPQLMFGDGRTIYAGGAPFLYDVDYLDDTTTITVSPLASDARVIAAGEWLSRVHGIRHDGDPTSELGEPLRMTVGPGMRSQSPASSSVIFSPPLDDAAYSTLAMGSAYEVENHGHVPIWVTGSLPPGLAPETDGRVWATSVTGIYPHLSNGTMWLKQLDLTAASAATLSFVTWFETEKGHDGGRLVARFSDGRTEVIESTSLPYAEMVDSTMAWTGSSAGWQDVVTDLSAYSGLIVDVGFEFRSDASGALGGWAIDDIRLLKDGTKAFEDGLTDLWQRSGDWTLTQPTTGPGSGYTSTNAWSVAPYAAYKSDGLSTLELPPKYVATDINVTLHFQHWLKTEYYHDRAAVEISPDNGTTWRPLEPLQGPSYDDLFAGKRGWSGSSLGWQHSVFELTPFTGQDLHIRFTFESDDTLESAGWYISDLLIQTGNPDADSAPAFASRADENAAFYAYFPSSGSEATIATPTGKQVTIRYIGTTGDVVAKLTGSGALTARRALVAFGTPTAVPASEFEVIGEPISGVLSSGTWKISPARTLTGYGGVRLEIGGKVFDNVATSSEPIHGVGSGRSSAAGLSNLSWNWHHQQTAIYDASPTSSSSPVETTLDQRLRYDPDIDGDSHSDKDEVAGFAGVNLASSTPLTDDDGDGIPNMIETSRDAALDFFSTALNPLIGGDLSDDDWAHMATSEQLSIRSENSQPADYDSDGVADYRDLANLPGESRAVVGPSPLENRLELNTVSAGLQLAVIISPDWNQALLVVIGSTQPDTGPTGISYDEFFSELNSYFELNAFEDVSEVDTFLDRVYRTHLDKSMTFTLVRKTIPVGVTAEVPLTFMEGTPGDGTWTVMRDVNLVSLALVVRNYRMSTNFDAAGLPDVGLLQVVWNFIDIHDAVGGTPSTGSCVSYRVLLRGNTCSDFPDIVGMRFYSRDASHHAAGLISLLRKEFRDAGLLPDVFRLVKESQASKPSGPESSEWGPSPTTEIIAQESQTITLADALLATADHASPSPRSFEWDLAYYAPDPTYTGEPRLTLGLEPSDGSQDGTYLLVHGAALGGLGFDPSEIYRVQLDRDHEESATWERGDYDGDDIPDYRIWIPHFSKSWVTIGTPGIKDVSMSSEGRAFALTECPYIYIYDIRHRPAWVRIQIPAPWNDCTTYEWQSVHALSDSEAWFSGFTWINGNFCGVAMRIRYESFDDGTGRVTEWAPFDYFNCYFSGPDERHSDIVALSSSSVWWAGTGGIFWFNGRSWGRSEVGNWEQLEFRSPTEGFASKNDGKSLYRWDGVTWKPLREFAGTSPWENALRISHDRTSLWRLAEVGDVDVWRSNCDCWSTFPVAAPAPSLHPISLYGFDEKNSWLTGYSGSVGGRVVRYGDGTWVEAQGDFSEGWWLSAIDFAAHNSGIIGSLGMIYHYRGSNSAPEARLTLDRSIVTTNDVVSASAASSSDADGDPLSYEWRWGDQSSSINGISASHRYRNSGSYTVDLKVRDTDGATNTATTTVSVTPYVLQNGVPLTQSFTAVGQMDYYKFVVPPDQDLLKVTLSGASDTNFDVFVRKGLKPTGAEFDAAGENPASDEDARIDLPLDTNYFVMVRATAGTGEYTLTAQTFVRPSVHVPVLTPNPVHASAATTLWSGGTSTSRVFYVIDWGDGTPNSRMPSQGTYETGTDFELAHTYGSIGEYVATVTVTDENGLSAARQWGISVRTEPSGHTSFASGIGYTEATLGGRISGFGGYSSATTWFEYGLDTQYGSATPHRSVSATAPVVEGVNGLLSNREYHYRIVIENDMGRTNGDDVAFHTLNNVPSAPSVAQSNTITKRDEVFTVSGTASDADGDPIYVVVDWGDSATSRYPQSGAMPSGSSYSVTHSYASRGTYYITASTFDATTTTSQASQSHRVIDPPAGQTLLPSSDPGPYGVTMRGEVLDLGGVSSVQAWFEYGRVGEGLPLETTHVTRTTGLFEVWVPLDDGTTYEYRLVIQNPRETRNMERVTITTDAIPVIRAIDLMPQVGWEDTIFSFTLLYSDALNEPPGSGYPYLSIGGKNHVMSKVDPAANNFVDGVMYAYRTTLPPGSPWYSYHADNSFAMGRHGHLRVVPSVVFEDPIDDASDTELPSTAWEATTSSQTGDVKWHTVITPNRDGIRDAPDTWPGGPLSTSLWFGDDNTGTYAAPEGRVYGSAMMPPMYLTGLSPSLTFWSYFETQDDGTQFDTKKVYLDPAGDEPEQLIATLHDRLHGREKWSPVSISLDPWVNQHVVIRFEFDTVTSEANDHPGWYLNEIVIGPDRDSDTVPDVVENRITYSVVATSPNQPSPVPPGSTGVANLWGAQNSMATFGQTEVTLVGSSTATTVALESEAWTKTILSNGILDPSTRKVPKGLGYTLITDLAAAGFDLAELEDPLDLKVSVTNHGTNSMTLYSFASDIGGKTHQDLPDSDGDGSGDGAELFDRGTGPLSRDPDNDAYHDGIDIRPWTPDDPPGITNIRPLNGQWLEGITFEVVTRWGVGSRDVVFVSEGTEHQLAATLNAGTYTAVFPGGTPSEVHIRVEDRFNNVMIVTLAYNAAQGVPDQINTAYLVLAGATYVRNAATAIPVTPNVPLTAFKIALLGLSLATPFVVEKFVATDSSGTDLPPEVRTRYPTNVVRHYPLAAGQLGCVAGLDLLEGEAGLYSHRGADGIMADYSEAYQSTAQVGDRIAAVLAGMPGNGAALVELDEHTGALIYVDDSLSILDGWVVKIDRSNAGTCFGEIVYERRLPVHDAAVMKRVLERIGGFLFGLLVAAAAIPNEDHAEADKPMIHVLDAKQDYAVVDTFKASVLRDIDWLLTRRLTDDDQMDDVRGWAAILVGYEVIHRMAERAPFRGSSAAPTWYWNTDVADRDARWTADHVPYELDQPLRTFALRDNLDPPATNAFDDLSASVVLSPGAAIQPEEKFDPVTLLRLAEKNIRTYNETYPADWWAYIPIASVRTDPLSIWVGLAEHTDEFRLSAGD